MKKDVFITSYFVDVILYDFPRSFKKKDEYEIVRAIQREAKGDNKRDLFNVERYVNDQRFKENLMSCMETAYAVWYDEYAEAVKNDKFWSYIEKVVKDRDL